MRVESALQNMTMEAISARNRGFSRSAAEFGRKALLVLL
jgi:hypothetical protein